MRWRRASKSATAAATLTLSDSRPGSSGIAIVPSHDRRTSGRTPFPSAPKTRAMPSVRSRSPDGVAVGGRGVRPEPIALHLAEIPGEIRDDRDREAFDGAGGRTADGRGDDRRSVGRKHHARRPGSRRAAHDGAEVPRIGDLVETAEKGRVDRGEIPRIGVGVWLAPRNDALMVCRARRFGHSRSRWTRGRGPSSSQSRVAAARSPTHTSSTARRPRSASRTALRP